MQNKEIIPIFFSSDDNYAPFLAVSVASLLENASDRYTYKIIVLINDHNFSEENKKKISEMTDGRAELEFVDMGDRLSFISDTATNRYHDRFTLAIYFRIFIPVMFPEYDKAIYLDCDIVVPGDISRLYMTDMGDSLLGAVADFSIFEVQPLVEYVEEVVGVPIDTYFNSGMLLMSLAKMREAEIDKRFLQLLTTYHFESVAPDQDYLNFMCNGRVTYVDKVWNYLAQAQVENDTYPEMIHYNLFSKPWQFGEIVPYSDCFWKYAAMTPYFDEIKYAADNFTDEERDAELQKLECMLERAVEIRRGSRITFARLFNSGAEDRLHSGRVLI